MAKSQIIHRHTAFQRQFSCCYYCRVPMWEGAPPQDVMQFAGSSKKAERLRCTAEHLLARSEGGLNTAENIVAACAFCNRRRHRGKQPLGPSEYRRYVCAEMTKGRWHPRWVHQLVITSPSESNTEKT